MSDCKSGTTNNISKGIVTLGGAAGGWLMGVVIILFNLFISVVLFISFYYFIYICFGDEDRPGNII